MPIITDNGAIINQPPAIRIAKYLARAGICSRRAAEQLINEGRVRIDHTYIDNPATMVTGLESIYIDGQKVKKPEATKLWRFHKPREMIVSHNDPQGRATIFDYLSNQGLGRVISIGRLDYYSEGLLLLTNDGELSRRLELSNLIRQYRVHLTSPLNDKQISALAKGVTIDNVNYAPIKVRQNDSWLHMSLTEGKNREIRRIMDYFDVGIYRLIRQSYGPFHLGNLGLGQVTITDQSVLSEEI